ncbi:MAG: Queuine tRNA-ribosyltransferase [Candidatus Gottesmanbacteria bacterium GW2011_GWC2_39_8]|uniref:Queuine tRNA-ribosyltransferase n=1 Tax=Candidatus Gottesmanbacteria bacterium GW2011_GWC2_39_8 TaxID=1618450 RepID=A0A0G0PUX9_9BACT|nr:MAG: Queuine tRNA-ribosyltransferase [Candidatus Gottesmanbacteria bacterium GW2011_GWC2_39_8]
MNYSFKVTHNDKKTKARLGVISCPHGTTETPAFLPVGTQATVKALTPEDFIRAGTKIIMVNTYHTFLRPGSSIIKSLGGLHKFMNYDGPMMTDSGGFQVFSLGFAMEHGVGFLIPLYGDEEVVKGETVEKTRTIQNSFMKFCRVTEEGANFISHLDGTKYLFTPEISAKTQIELGADFITALDECTSPLHDFDYTKVSMERTHRWEKRSLDYLKKNGGKNKQAMYGVTQGGSFDDLRIVSTKFVNDEDFFGVAIGGAFINKPRLYHILDITIPHLTAVKPRHLLGIGSVEDIFEAVERGVDTFDCVSPTRLGRMGHAYINLKFKNPSKISDEILQGKQNLKVNRKFTINLTNSIFKEDKGVIDSECGCYTCVSGFSKAYLRHLFWAKELLAYRLLSIHNVYFLNNLMFQIRESIGNGNLLDLKRNWLV